MDILHHHRRLPRQLMLSLATIVFLLLASVSTQGFNFNPTRRLSVSVKKIIEDGAKRVNELGSSPPTCHSRCGECSPCKPVLVPIHPGSSPESEEYYPEVWRCKCGDKLFMP